MLTSDFLRTDTIHHSARRPRQELHFLPVADFLTGYTVDGCSYAVENDDRTLCVLQDRLVFLVELFARPQSRNSSRASRRQLTWPLLL
jgi:hypothetical protein